MTKNQCIALASIISFARLSHLSRFPFLGDSMSTVYGLSDAQRSITIAKLETWLRDSSLHTLYTDKISGRGRTRTQSQVGEYSSDLVAAMGPADSVLDEVIQAHGALGGVVQIRAVFCGEDGAPEWEKQLRTSFNLVRRDPGAGKGASSAVEGIASTLSNAMSSHTRQLGTLYDRLDHVSTALVDRSLQGQEQRLADVLALQSRISELQIELVRAEMRADIAENMPEGLIDKMPPEAIGAIVSQFLPLVTELLGAGISRLKGDQAHQLDQPDPDPAPEA